MQAKRVEIDSKGRLKYIASELVACNCLIHAMIQIC